MLTNFVIDLLVVKVGFGAKACFLASSEYLLGIFIGIRYDGWHHHLHWRQPKWQMPGVMLDQDAGKALQTAEERAVDHHGSMPRPVLPDIEGAKAPGQVEIELHCAALPLAANCVAQRVFKLGSVESPFAW